MNRFVLTLAIVAVAAGAQAWGADCQKAGDAISTLRAVRSQLALVVRDPKGRPAEACPWFRLQARRIRRAVGAVGPVSGIGLAASVNKAYVEVASYLDLLCDSVKKGQLEEWTRVQAQEIVFRTDWAVNNTAFLLTEVHPACSEDVLLYSVVSPPHTAEGEARDKGVERAENLTDRAEGWAELHAARVSGVAGLH